MKQKKSQKNYKKKYPITYQIKPFFDKNIKKSLINYIKGDNWITEYKFTENLRKFC